MHLKVSFENVKCRLTDSNFFYPHPGIVSGKFLERERIKKPDQPRFGTELSEYFTAKDLYVGSRLDFHGHYFILIDADEYAFLYMEKHAHEVSPLYLAARCKLMHQVQFFSSFFVVFVAE